jgi:hypothetical protein
MTGFAVATEDALSEAVAEKLLLQAGSHSVVKRLRKSGFGYLKGRISDFNRMAAKVMPVLLVTDLDRLECAPELVTSWLPGGPDANLLFRVAIRETESWVLADRSAFAEFLGCFHRQGTRQPDDLQTPSVPCSISFVNRGGGT